jgi:hypothetical protein
MSKAYAICGDNMCYREVYTKEEEECTRPVYYNTVGAMKTDTKLVNGMKIVTLGYYALNDGGGATYLIREKTSNDVEDNGSIHFVGSLVAELIIKNEINVKQFGAKGDGINDDTTFIQNAIDFLKNKFSSDKIFNNSLTLTIPHGRYLITDTINLPIVVKFNIVGDVLWLSNVENKPTLWINSGKFTKIADGLNIIRQQSYNIAKTIEGNGVFCIERNTEDNEKDVNDLTQKSIAIEIGDREHNSTYLNCARNTYENIAISGFAIGIQLNSINTYLINFKNIKLERNRIDFQYGKDGMVVENSGENIKFHDSTFAQSYNAFINNAGAQFSFENCSFDFNGNDFLLNKPTHIVLNACHIEGIGFSQTGIIEANDNNCVGFGTIIYNNFNSSSKSEVSTIEMNNPNFYLASSHSKLIPRYQSIFNGSYPNLIINFNNLQYFIEGGYVYENAFLNGQNVQINNFDSTMRNSTIPQIPFNISDNSGKLNNIPDNVTSLDNLKNNYNIETQNIESVVVDTENKIFNKSLKFKIANKTYFNIRRSINNVRSKKINFACYFKDSIVGDSDVFDHFYVQVTVGFYNSNNISVKENLTLYLTNADLNILKSSNSDWKLIKPCTVDVPTNTAKVMITYSLTNKNANDTTIACTGDFWLGGIIVDD